MRKGIALSLLRPGGTGVVDGSEVSRLVMWMESCLVLGIPFEVKVDSSGDLEGKMEEDSSPSCEEHEWFTDRGGTERCWHCKQPREVDDELPSAKPEAEGF